MTQTPDTFQNLTEAEIEEIIAKVEASKPWSGWVRTGELFFLRLYTTIAFTLMGLHFCFSKFSYLPNTEISYGVFSVFVMLDIFFFYNKNKFDRRTIADWTRAILTQEDFFKENGYGHLKWTTIIYIALVMLVCTVTNNPHIHYSLAFAYTLIMAVWYKRFNVFFFWHKRMHDYRTFMAGMPFSATLESFVLIFFVIPLMIIFYFTIHLSKNLLFYEELIFFTFSPIFFLFYIFLFNRLLKLSFLAEMLVINFNNLNTRKIT